MTIDDLLRAQIISGISRIAERLENVERPYPPQERGQDAHELRNILRKI